MPVNKRYFSDLMKDRKVSLREVARRMEVWPAALSRSLDDKRKMQMEEAVQLARILSVPLAEVEGGSWMLGTIRRGYTPGTFNVFKPMRDQLKNVRIEWARRAIITVH